MSDLLFKDEAFAIVGAAMEVHTLLGPGFLEPVYQEAFEIELALRTVPFKARVELPIYYKRQCLRKTYIADFVVYERIIVEIKALTQLASREDAQVLNYLKATRFSLGILINFGSHGRLEWKRLVSTQGDEPQRTRRYAKNSNES